MTSISRVLGCFLLLSASVAVGCKKDEPVPAPAAAASSVVAAAATSAAHVASAAASAAAKATINAKKSIPTEKQPHPVPTEWTELTQATKGFSFSVPKGSTDKAESQGGVDMYVAKLPKPHEVDVFVMAYKNAHKSKADLIQDAIKVMEASGAKEVKAGEAHELNEDYSLVDFTYVDNDPKDQKSKARVLVATDVTDNYIMILGSSEASFKQNEETIDTIWGSFDMFSGGASGESH